MSQRIIALTIHLLKQHLRSIAGSLYILSAFAFWLLFFNPLSGSTTEGDYFILSLALYGFLLSILVTLNIASNANRLEMASFFPRLPSRVEFLASVLISTLTFVLTIQFALCLIILLQPVGPDPGLRTMFDVPPLWIAINIFAVVLALHATDFVMSGWSRVWVFGIMTLLLFSQSIDARGTRWFVNRVNQIAGWAGRQQYTGIAQNMRNLANWISTNSLDFLSQTIGFVFWPFRAIAEGVRAGGFDSAQALAPAILLLYATILFMLAADLFASKDLQLSE